MLLKAPPLWRQIQRDNFTSIDKLLDFLEMDTSKKSRVFVSPKFILNLPKRLAEKIPKNTLDDPILKQFIPLQEETLEVPGFKLDPVQDQSFCKTGKYLQKYRGRALLLATSACAMHCRFCFRQNFPYETNASMFEEEVALLKEDLSIEEVILSGGDPLSLANDTLAQLFDAIDGIDHIQRIRFHTRFPIGIPERIDDAFLKILQSSSKQIFFAIHCNHPSELDKDVLSALRKILKLGIVVLNQSVLLKEVNDDAATLTALCRCLVNHGILPYYLHILDLVQGASHFLVSEEKAISLMQGMQKNLSGFALPRLVKEEPGQLSKTIVF